MPRKRNQFFQLLFVIKSSSLFLIVVLLFILYLLLSFSSKATLPQNHAVHSPRDQKFCSSSPTSQFLFYAPHSGFSNQLSELKNAFLIAGILNRTLVIPPVLDHHAVVLGSCPKFRVTEPRDIRTSVWNHSFDLLNSGRYVSMAEIIDISSLVPSSVRTIDFRVFASILCNIDATAACAKAQTGHPSMFEQIKMCGSEALGFPIESTNCVYLVNNDCRNTVWTYESGEKDGTEDSLQPDEQLKKKKKITHVRLRRDIYKELGPNSAAGSFKVLAFGSLFTSLYKNSQLLIDINKSHTNAKIHSLMKKLEFLPFVSEIMDAGRTISSQIIKSPFLCAQLRLLDGQFKNHWEATFLGLKQKVESLKTDTYPVHIFVMTDLVQEKWVGTYLGELLRAEEHYRIHVVREDDEVVVETAKKVANLSEMGAKKDDIFVKKLPDVLLYVEESVCSCASLGFVGTAGSTIAESIDIMRKHRVCNLMN